MDFSKIKNIYMIGIKGVGMTMLAQFLKTQGFNVQGSDIPEVFMTDQVLKKVEIDVFLGFNKDNIKKDIDLVIYSTAYNKNNNPELDKVLSGNFKVLTYAEALAEIFNKYYGVGVAGSHGKTTTTAWLGFVLEKSGLDPNVMVGARVPQFNGSSLTGDSKYLVVELDEYQNKLKYFYPKIALLNNIDFDHPDFFSDFDEYKKVFIDFIKKIPKNGLLIANFDDEEIRKLAPVNCLGQVVSYSIKEKADYMAYDIRKENGKFYFKVKINSEADNLLGDFSISLLGEHNVYNALAVITTCIELNVDLADIRTYLEEFLGTTRRMEVLGKYNGATIIDDYAHHPTEVKATISALKDKYKNKELVIVFHPHTYTRTKGLLKEFSQSFFQADKVIILDIYGSAREEQGGVHSKDLVQKIKEQDSAKEILYIPDLKEVERYLRENTSSDQVVALLGAGDIFRVGENLVK